MKRLLQSASLLLVTLFLFSACGKSTPPKPAEIYGIWQTSGRTAFAFTRDGKFTETDTIEKKTTETGSFTLQGKELLIKTESGRELQYRVIRITADQARLHPYRNGKVMSSHRRWQRIK